MGNCNHEPKKLITVDCEKPTNSENSDYTNTCIEKIKNSGLRLTKPRLAVIKLLNREEKPLSASKIYEKLLEEYNSKKSTSSKPDKVSVYRTVDRLYSLELVHKVLPTGDYIACTHAKCTEGFHVILQCINCGSVSEVGIPSHIGDILIEHLKENHLFKVDKHRFNVEGTCDHC